MLIISIVIILLVQADLNEGRIVAQLYDSALGHEYTFNTSVDSLETELVSQHKTSDRLINDIPKELDWRNYGVVTTVKNQGEKGSYLVPLIVEMIESELAVKTGKLITLSLQQIYNCCSECKREGNSSVAGIWKYVGEFGLESEEDYPQAAGTNPCKYNGKLVVPDTRGVRFELVSRGNETSLEVACAERGPVFVMVDVVESFEFYTSGIFYAQDCDPNRLNHEMLLVGYGSEGVDEYWLVKNSWGEQWGDGGYAKMSRNRNDNCGIANFAFTVVFPKSHRG